MRYFLRTITILSCFGLFVPFAVSAAQLHFIRDTDSVRVGDQFAISMFVDTQGEAINAFEGTVVFSGLRARVEDIREGNSVVNVWIEKPHEENGTIVFSGITPGGFDGNNGFMLSVIFRATSEGVAYISMKDAMLLRNDGEGSPAHIAVTPISIPISRLIPGAPPSVVGVYDTERPEPFVPAISRDRSIADGKWFLAFSAQDKSSGIDHYEIKEVGGKILSFLTAWSDGSSPHILRDQTLQSHIFVKAVDTAGNERVVIFSPENPRLWYQNYEIWIIILFMVMAGVVISLLIRRRF